MRRGEQQIDAKRRERKKHKYKERIEENEYEKEIEKTHVKRIFL